MKSILQEIVFPAPAKRIYEALTSAKQFSQVTGGAPTEISAEAGGAFSAFGGMISGRQIELVPNERIVQAWRAGNWAAGVYLIARFELREQGGETRLTFEHSGFPEEQREHLAAGWETNYWEPLKRFLA